jgi:hypothetical protein
MVKDYIGESLLPFYEQLIKIYSSLRSLAHTEFGVEDSTSLQDLSQELIQLEKGKS